MSFQVKRNPDLLSDTELPRLVVVDDDATQRRVFRKMLERSGYAVLECSSGEEALQVVFNNRVSMVLMDIIMPELNGLDVLKKIRESYSISDLPVIMVSVIGDSKDIVKALALGANDYISKPVDLPVLCARINTHLSHKQAEDELLKTRNELERRVEERTATLLAANQALEREIVDRKLVEKRLREAQRISHLGIWEQDYLTGEIYWSEEIYSIFGVDPESFIPDRDMIVNLVHPDDREFVLVQRLTTMESDIPFNVKYRIVRPNGEIRHVHGQGEIIRDEQGNPLRFTGTIIDDTELNELSGQLSYQSSHDPLSGLLNRREFESHLQRIMESARVENSEHVLCYLDLDQFKVINNTYGHVAGDELIRQLSRFLQGLLRKHDILARMGGDEFGLLLEYCPLSHAEKVLAGLRKSLESFEFEWEGKIFTITASIGVVPVNRNSISITDIMSMADIACYAAKEAGRNRIYTHTPENNSAEKKQKEMYWVERINRAIQEHRLKLYFQPIVALKDSSHHTHYELFIRMKDETGEIIQPGAFLPAAERYSLSAKIDQWVIQTTFSWLESNPNLPLQNCCFGINLSGQSLADMEMLKFLESEIKQKKIKPDSVYFEITETAAISNFKNAQGFINSMKKEGFSFALDDFGSGLSSFSYLRNLDVDFLKIDGQFVKNIAQNNIDYEMVIAINRICKTMKKKTIAEFVEDEITMIKLQDIGVDYGQGYYFGKPEPLEKLFS